MTLFPVVTFRKDEFGNLLEDHLVFLSDDLNHDCAFVELCNEKIHNYYKETNIEITHDIEFNDGCASQFKSIRAFSLFSHRPIHTDCIFFESSHGKGPSDGVGGVIKSVAANAVCAEKILLRDGKELYEFLVERCTLQRDISALKKKHCVMTRKFVFIETQEICSYRDALTAKDVPTKSLKGTRKLHQITSLSIPNQILIRTYACLCSACQSLVDGCESHELLGDFVQRKVAFLSKPAEGINDIPDDDDDDDDDVEIDEDIDDVQDNWELSEAVQMIQPKDVIIIRSDDGFHPYYLVKTLNTSLQLTELFCDDYGHSFNVGQSIVKGHYLEHHKKVKDVTYLYEDVGKTVAVSTFCVVGITPSLTISKGTRKRKEVELFEITTDIHEVLLGLVTGYDY